MLALIAWVLYTKEDQKPCVVNVVNQVNQGCSLCEAATAKDKKLPSFVKKRKGKKHVCPNTTEPTQQQTQEKQVNTVPEPGTVVLMGIGSVGLLVTLRHS